MSELWADDIQDTDLKESVRVSIPIEMKVFQYGHSIWVVADNCEFTKLWQTGGG
jgi:hypothetical protein